MSPGGTIVSALASRVRIHLRVNSSMLSTQIHPTLIREYVASSAGIKIKIGSGAALANYRTRVLNDRNNVGCSYIRPTV